MTLPRLGFALTNWEYDSTRKRTTMTRKVLQSGTTNEDKKMQFRFAEVPYNLTFELYIMPDTMDNGLRIVEQILPYFTPSYTVSINFNDLDKKIDIPITLSSVGWEDDYEGSFDTVRTMMYTLQFEAKSYLMGPINETKVILETQWSAHEFDDLGKPRAETRDFLRVWDRAVPEGATGTPPELADNSTNFEVWQDHELFADIDESWEAE
jgi:5-hydroxyisourate hydrolase-like protein (transthyretin family)